jgi:pimeloyl-ACP methyl ester carboxylesterase
MRVLVIAGAGIAIAVAAIASPLAAPLFPAPEGPRLVMSAPRYLDRPEGRIAYEEAGTGPLVVLVPGLGDLRQEYRFLAPQLAAAGHRVVTMDLRGHGQSSVGWPSYSASAIGSDIVALVRHLDAGPATLIGTSMGAAAIASAAVEAPELVERLVMIGPFVRKIPTSWFKGAMQGLMLRTAFAGPWAPSAWVSYVGTLYPSGKPADWPEYRASLSDMVREPGRMAALKAMMFAGREDIEPRLGEVAAPTLVIMGSKDPDFADPAAEARTVADLLRGEVAMVEGAGHYPQAEMPAPTAQAILAFFEKQPGA